METMVIPERSRRARSLFFMSGPEIFNYRNIESQFAPIQLVGIK
jgi:hypothetical protein